MFGQISDETMTGNECDFCFIRYIIKQIQGAQLRLKREQMDVAADFEEAIRLILSHGECPCVFSYREMVLRKNCDFLMDVAVHTISIFNSSTCGKCAFANPVNVNGRDIERAVRLSRESFVKLRPAYDAESFLEDCYCRMFPKALKVLGNKYPEAVPWFRTHFESPRLLCQEIETETGKIPVEEFFGELLGEPVFQFMTLLARCQKRLYFPMEPVYDDEGCSFRPKTWRDLWTISREAASLAVQISLFLPVFETEYQVEKVTRTLTDFHMAIARYCIGN